MFPASTFPGGDGIRRRTDIAVTDFPHPLSPTSATVCPGKIENDTSRTGRTSPRLVSNATFRPVTSRSGRWERFIQQALFTAELFHHGLYSPRRHGDTEASLNPRGHTANARY